MFDDALVADAIENGSTRPIGRAVAAPGLLGESLTVVSQGGVDLGCKCLHDLT